MNILGNDFCSEIVFTSKKKLLDKNTIRQKSSFLTKERIFQTVWDISSICSFEVRIRIESLAMQNCESRNCQFSRKSRNIQNCFWRPSSQFTGLTWISMTLDVLLQTKVWKVWMKQQMFSKHFQTSVSTNKKIAVSSLGRDRMGSGDQKVLVLFSLLLRGEIGYEIKTERTKKLKTQLFLFNSSG